MTPTLRHAWIAYPLPEKPSEHFYNASRHAIAHVLRGNKPVIDPDLDPDRRRLDWESRFLEILVPPAIQQVFGNPISAG